MKVRGSSDDVSRVRNPSQMRSVKTPAKDEAKVRPLTHDEARVRISKVEAMVTEPSNEARVRGHSCDKVMFRGPAEHEVRAK